MLLFSIIFNNYLPRTEEAHASLAATVSAAGGNRRLSHLELATLATLAHLATFTRLATHRHLTHLARREVNLARARTVV